MDTHVQKDIPQYASVIVCTKNRCTALRACLASIVESIEHASAKAEIVVVDNGSTDETPDFLKNWHPTVPVKILTENRPGKGAALNTALKHASGGLLIFTDDDCRMGPNYILDALRYDADDSELVIRGGRVELGNPDDFPIVINLLNEHTLVRRSLNSARTTHIAGQILGCNMTMRRDLANRLGAFDERFGPGSLMNSAEDTDYICRAYLLDIPLIHVPDMTIFHHHGRNTPASVYILWKSYMIGQGGIYIKHFLKCPYLAKAFYWDVKNAVIEIASSENTFLPGTPFSHRHKVYFTIIGVFRYGIVRFKRI